MNQQKSEHPSIEIIITPDNDGCPDEVISSWLCWQGPKFGADRDDTFLLEAMSDITEYVTGVDLSLFISKWQKRSELLNVAYRISPEMYALERSLRKVQKSQRNCYL